MRAEIRRLQRRLGVTSLYVTHDQVEAMTLGDRLLVLHGGRPVQLATPMEVFARPADTYVAGFIGAPAMNLLPGELVGDAVRLAGGHTVPLASPRAGGPAVTLGVRPEHVVLSPGGLPLQVELVEPLGSETLVHGRMADGTALLAKLPGAMPVADAVSVALMSGTPAPVRPRKREAAGRVRIWSGREDSNLRPLAPEASVLPGCTTPRLWRRYRPGWAEGASDACGPIASCPGSCAWSQPVDLLSCTPHNAGHCGVHPAGMGNKR